VFTPEFTTTNFAELPFSARFGKQAQKELKAHLFNGNEATTTALKNTPNNLLHISTHAVISDEVALNYMQFADAPFYQKEVADLKHVPQLTVVNTCNSGMGRKLQGDGINGFVRELHKVGVLATLANLWEVDDQASNQLFFTFYKELKTGANTLEALRKSKLTHIKNAANSKLAAPYYWAGHQLVGSNIAVTQHTNYWWWIILGSSFIGFACWWLMKLFKVPSIN
jgi:CHAT domain-containing protein